MIGASTVGAAGPAARQTKGEKAQAGKGGPLARPYNVGFGHSFINFRKFPIHRGGQIV